MAATIGTGRISRLRCLGISVAITLGPSTVSRGTFGNFLPVAVVLDP